jgi:hypothetical protein
MTELWAAITAAAVALPQAYYERGVEAPEERAQRLSELGQGFALAAEKATCTGQPSPCKRWWPGSARELGGLLLTQAWFESRLARNVQHGACLPKQCDPARDRRTGEVFFQSLGPLQIKKSLLVPEPIWMGLAGPGVEPMVLSGLAGTRMLWAARQRCARLGRDWVEATIAGYATGNACEWAGAAERAAFFRRLSL